MTHTWIMVANATTARFFEANNNNELKELEAMSHPEGRLHERDLVSAKPGRDYESANPARHSMVPRTSAKKLEFEHFASSLSEHLRDAYRQGKFKKLYIAASPLFLGILRQNVDDGVANAIAGEFNIDMTQMTPGDIRKHLPYVL